MAMKMAKIMDCEMSDCAYNSDMACHALAITVGAESPMCDTFMTFSQKGGDMDEKGGVGACKDAACKFNNMLECSAGMIHIARHADHAECSTFMQR